ncbi:MAG: Mrp/NBP35 family ATP-binding protein [Lentisphaeria bacterium]|nr:Mrp/NBP35 family ATP-binding protein [Lentisphaeria bacterium]
MADKEKCGGNPSAGGLDAVIVKNSLAKIKNKLVVMSGKGGVGKSTVAVNLAMALAMEGYSVGLLDIDLHGPSVPKMLKLEDEAPEAENDRMIPVSFGGLKVMSVGFLLRDPDEAVIWRGPMKMGVIKQFITDVTWGELDYLVVDAPPGTGDEPLTICQLLGPEAGAVIVTTPQQVAAVDVAKSINFCCQLEMPVVGVIENMSGFACPHCGKVTDIFSSGAGEALARKFGVELLGKIPIDPAICRDGDEGTPFIHHDARTATGRAFAAIVRKISGGSASK